LGNPRILKKLKSLTVKPRLEQGAAADNSKRIAVALFIKLLTHPLDVFFATKLVRYLD
jgi:hypothetical protein